jgi:hypothetical protein
MPNRLDKYRYGKSMIEIEKVVQRVDAVTSHSGGKHHSQLRTNF